LEKGTVTKKPCRSVILKERVAFQYFFTIQCVIATQTYQSVNGNSDSLEK